MISIKGEIFILKACSQECVGLVHGCIVEFINDIKVEGEVSKIPHKLVCSLLPPLLLCSAY